MKGGSEHIVLEDTRFNISRTVTKTNSSHYEINGRRVPFGEVSKRLQECGVDLRYNRFLILQGEVEQISLMKPKSENGVEVGMLEYLEDIIGTARFKQPIDQLNNKYNETNELRTQCMNRVNNTRKELRAVEDLKNEAVHYIELENEKKIERSKLLQFELNKIASKLDAEEAEFEEYRSQMTSKQAEIDRLENEKSELQNQSTLINDELETVKKNTADLKEKFAKCEKDDYYLNSKLKTASEKLKKFKKSVEANKKKLEELEKNVENIQNIDELQQRHDSVKAKIENELKDLNQQMKDQTELAQGENAELIKQRSQLDAELLQFENEQTGKKKQMKDAQDQLIIQQQRHEAAINKLRQAEDKLTKLNEQNKTKLECIERYVFWSFF